MYIHIIICIYILLLNIDNLIINIFNINIILYINKYLIMQLIIILNKTYFFNKFKLLYQKNLYIICIIINV